jgi:DNA processing protein
VAACRRCRRRSWLLGELSALLDYHRADPQRLMALLALSDEELISALGGRRRSELSTAWSAFGASAAACGSGPSVGSLCRHNELWPARLGDGDPPATLWLRAPASRLERLLDGPTVALLGSRDPSPYGAAMATGLARGLAAAGVTVLGPLEGRLAAAVHRGTLEGDGRPLALAGNGLDRIRPASADRLARELSRRGSVLSELPAQATGRGWGAGAALRTVVGLADLTVYVEAQPGPRELLGAVTATSLGRPVAALPGLATSTLSDGPHSLIRSGATLVRDAEDVLEALYECGRDDLAPAATRVPRAPLAPALQRILLRVGAGEDSAERLARGAEDPGAVMAALGELEAAGLLERLPGGRYVGREPIAREHPAS